MDLKLTKIGVDLNFRKYEIADSSKFAYYRHLFLNRFNFYQLEVELDTIFVDYFRYEGYFAWLRLFLNFINKILSVEFDFQLIVR
jgi:hypothetical protein